MAFVRDHALKKSLGQNFLRDSSVCRRMGALLTTGEEELLLEIGPGAGALTTLLETLPHKHLLLLEKDDYWASERQKAAHKGTQCLHIDALTFDFSRLASAQTTIVGNLPYNVASPLIWDILSHCIPFHQALFMVQKEVGRRLCAKPGNREYGALSVWVQSFASPTLAFTVSPGAFLPPPKVDSAVVLFKPIQAPSPSLLPPLKRLLALTFQKRRKQLFGILQKAGLPDVKVALEHLALSPSVRPEELSVQNFHFLAAFFSHVLTEAD